MKIYKILPYIILLNLLFTYSCEISPTLGVEGGEDTGYYLSILNYSEKSYTGCTFYMGYKNESNSFVAVDSLKYPDLAVFDRTKGDYVDIQNKYSITYPHLHSSRGLNEYNVWEPNYQKLRENSIDSLTYFKVNLQGIEVLSNGTKFIGNATLTILEDGSLAI